MNIKEFSKNKAMQLHATYKELCGAEKAVHEAIKQAECIRTLAPMEDRNKWDEVIKELNKL
jgi:hypothetical protein